VQQVPPLAKLVEARRRLSDLLSKMDGNEKLGELLQQIVENTCSQKQLSEALGIKPVEEGAEVKEVPKE
jgi:type VI secretion system protein ImpB